MPWEVHPVSEIRLAFVHQVLSLKIPIAAACRTFGISRKTGHKWLRRYRAEPGKALIDRSRRPLPCPHLHRSHRGHSPGPRRIRLGAP